MCKSEFHGFLQALPKCEHHIHLEGALSPEVLFTLAKRNSITLPENDAAFTSPEGLLARYRKFTSLDDFLHYYYIGMSVLIHASDFEALAWDYFTHASSDGVHHAEVFFDPQAHLSRGISYTTVLDGFSAARRRAEAELGITTELICCFMRHLPVPDALATFGHEEVQRSYTEGHVRGIGLDSSEKGFPPHLFEEMYARAGELGLRRTAHAGEEGPAEFIASALDTLGVERIDHGIKLIHDEELLKKVAAQGTMLTACPMSNVVLRCVDHISEVPIRKFLDAGVNFSINSDDPAYFGGYILDNYCAVHDAFELNPKDWEKICRASILGSWCEEKRKEQLLSRLDSVMKEWHPKLVAAAA